MIVFPLTGEDVCGPRRTLEAYQQDVLASKRLKKKQTSRGVKGPCILEKLRHYQPMMSTNIDYMHSLLEGVI